MANIRALSVSDPPTRASVWKMLNNVWGHLTGNISPTDWDAPGLIMSQIHFSSDGHAHMETTGHSLVTTSIRKKMFAINDLNVAWVDYFNNPSTIHQYAILAGRGTMEMSASSTPGGTFFGTDFIDYNPAITSGAKPGNGILDIHALNQYDSAYFTTVTSGTGAWTLVGAWACPDNDMEGTYQNEAGQRRVYLQRWGLNATNEPFFCFQASSYATVSHTIGYTYMVLIRL